MTHVVTEPWIRCKYTDCVDVCSVDAFCDGKNMLVIDPDECIDCRLCMPECPVEAIRVLVAHRGLFNGVLSADTGTR